ncbi:hypothetical protein [Ancylobacter terrae]|uniref:hypothetical protein n=1 Tax=Ancylobacter sp. sgz301288 TaxID=3342077 RepID=UPI003858B1BE
MTHEGLAPEARDRVLRLLHRAFLDIRVIAHEKEARGIFQIGDLFHNTPLQMLSAGSEDDYRRILDDIRQRAERNGIAGWLDTASADIERSRD